ncbi:mRNA interferase toxin of toxin-antitoxin pair YafQ/DinJ (plasmid) [Candidatus Megaera polyxenophila]|jgi:mRNA interferase YafQ|nr:mRNA interferase toxin of toxin-antitoxin pair YafQ/DinJ [Candidatus Megaera polyxenophila]
MIKTVATNRYEKELKLMIKRGKDLNKLDYLLEILEANINKKIKHHLLLPEKYCLHKLIGKYKGYWECHIEPDWLLVYYLDDEVLRLERTGTHNDIFK